MANNNTRERAPSESSNVRFRLNYAEASKVDSSRLESSLVDDDTAANKSGEFHSENEQPSRSMEISASSNSEQFSRFKRRSSPASSKWRRESQWVRMSKYGVLLFLAVTCAGCATGMYFMTKASEETNFEEEVRFCVE